MTDSLSRTLKALRTEPISSSGQGSLHESRCLPPLTCPGLRREFPLDQCGRHISGALICLFAILQEHTVPLTRWSSLQARAATPSRHGEGATEGRRSAREAFWVVRLPDGHAVSLTPSSCRFSCRCTFRVWFTSMPMAATSNRRIASRKIMEKISASIVAAISVPLCTRRAIMVRSASGAATGVRVRFRHHHVRSAAALWQHGAGELFVCALFLLTGECTRYRAIAAGIVLGLIACNRPPDAHRGIARHLRAVVGTALPAVSHCRRAAATVPLLVYNVGVVSRHIAGAY